MHSALLPTFFCMERHLDRCKEGFKKRQTSNRDEIFRRTAGCTHFDIHKRHEEILKELKVEPVDKTQIKFATTCNKNEQQRGANSSAEL